MAVSAASRRLRKHMILEAVAIGRKAEDRWLLNEISVGVGAGQRIALVGPSGSGKTLLLRSLVLLDPLDAGEVRWRGNAVHGQQVPAFRGRVIYLPQRPALSEGTVEDNLRQVFSLTVHRGKQFDRQRALGWLQSLGRSESFLTRRQQDLSGGEAQLTALLRALQVDPDVLLLDEPTVALDDQAVGDVESLLDQWCGQLPDERAMVWVTHDRQQAERVATSQLRLRDGRLDKGG